MKVPSIVILGYSEAAMFLRGSDGMRVRAVISIFGEQEFGVDVDAGVEKLVLQFDDVETPDPADHVASYHARQRMREAAEMGRRNQRGPTLDDARAIVEFASRVKDVDGIVLCHCWAGVCRSPAAALICLAVWTGPGHEEACFQRLKEVRSCASPHYGLVRFADSLMGRGGKLAGLLGNEKIEHL